MKKVEANIIYNLPDWANFIARDIDGEWFCFQNEPQLTHYGLWVEASGRCMIFAKDFLIKEQKLLPEETLRQVN